MGSAVGVQKENSDNVLIQGMNLTEKEIAEQIQALFTMNPGKVRRFIKIAQNTVDEQEKALRQGLRKSMGVAIEGTHLIENMVNEEFGEDISAVYSIDPGSCLGSGLSGTVIKAKHRVTGIQFALKTLELKQSDRENQDLKNELKIMAQLDHPNIVRLVETYYTKDCVHLIMELCPGGELFDRLLERRRYHEDQARDLIRKVLNVVRFCHDRGIVHRDLKLENILFDSRGEGAEVKICDFGLSKRYGSSIKNMSDKVGTPYYMAPEVLDGQYDEKCDLWSVGVITFMLLTGKPPFPGATNEDIMNHVCTWPLQLCDRDFKDKSKESREFIKKLLDRDRYNRPSAAEALTLPWMTMQQTKIEAPLQVTVQQLMAYSEYPTLKRLALEMVTFNFNPDEIKAMVPEFQKFDVNNHGEIRIEDFQEALTNLTKQEVNAETVKLLFAQMDTDKSGSISWHEFLAACMSSCKLDDDKYLKNAFAHIDKEGKGAIVRSDIQRLMGQDAAKSDVDAVFEEVGDDSIDYEEFAKMVQVKPRLRKLSALTRVMPTTSSK